MANDSVGVAAASSPTNYIDNESISTGGSPATVDRQRVRVGGANYADLADVVTGDSGQGALLTAGNRKEVSFSTATTGIVASTEVTSYRTAVFHFTSVPGSCTINFQGSNDNSNWNALVAYNANIGNAVSSNQPFQTSVSAGNLGVNNNVWVVPLTTRYVRLNITGNTGTIAGLMELFSVPTETIKWVGGVIDLSRNGNSADGAFASSVYLAACYNSIYNGSTFDRQRGPTKFFTATATASGNTAVWTPTSGKKFRLMRYIVEITANAAKSSGGLVEITFQDSATAIGLGHSIFAPSAAATAFQPGDDTGWIDLGNGYLSAAANNVLNVNLSAALTSGEVRVTACGTEE